MRNLDTIEWSDALLTGVAEMDQQHRILVDTLIEARTNLTDDASKPLFERITRDLLAYAIYHFNTEEQLMLRYAYAVAAPEAVAGHLAAHRHFSERVVELRSAARLGKMGSRDALLSFLETWLVDHILKVDKQLGQFLGSTAKSPSQIV
jgi:hemerythrin-like metal-binding protein